jgi:hypothetical protein
MLLCAMPFPKTSSLTTKTPHVLTPLATVSLIFQLGSFVLPCARPFPQTNILAETPNFFTPLVLAAVFSLTPQFLSYLDVAYFCCLVPGRFSIHVYGEKTHLLTLLALAAVL